MKKLVISLLRRADRKVAFQLNNLQDFEYIEAVDGQNNHFRHITGRKDWIDPFKNRPLQQSEVACFLSHIKAWKRCYELNQPCIIMEDDVVINDLYNEDLYKDLQQEFVYLQRNENEPKKTLNLSQQLPHADLLEIPFYPYNMTAYYLTPAGALRLLQEIDYNDFIPVDEFLPECIQSGNIINAAAFKIDHCDQRSRKDYYSDIEQSKPFRNFKIHAVTCGTDRKKCSKLNTSAAHHGVAITNIGTNIVWKGTDMSFMGGGMKVNLMKEYLKTIHDEDVIVFTDAYDVFYADNLDTILERYLDFGKEVVFSGELFCYPDSSIADQFPNSPTDFKYINSGTYVGRARELKRIFNYYEIADDDDDQLYCQKCFLSGNFNIGIDYECYIFQTNYDRTIKLGDQLNNPDTYCCPCIYHGNGGESAADKFNSLYDEFYPSRAALYIPHYNKIEQIDKDMLIVDFMTQEQCERLIEIADDHGGWDSLEYDKFPAKEIRLQQIDKDKRTNLFAELDKHWKDHIVPTVEQYWKPLLMHGIRDAFVMRYSMDTQVKLALHHDASLVTGSVKLNDDYLGAELIYPRQGFSNKDVPVGKMILFPAAVTHGHECMPLKAGVKYSYTIWSCRYTGDTI